MLRLPHENQRDYRQLTSDDFDARIDTIAFGNFN